MRSYVCGTLLLMSVAGSATAADDLWVGNTSPNWNDANWTGGSNPPVAGDSLFFGPAGSAGVILTNNFANGLSVSGIVFNADASAYTISPNWTILLGDIVNNSTNVQTLNLGHQLNTNVQFNAAAGGLQFGVNNTINLNGNTLTVTGAFDTAINLVVGGVSTNSRIVKSGSGALTLSRANQFVGDLMISGGTVIDPVAANNANPTATGLGNMTVTGRQILVGTNATLRFTANDTMGSYQYKTPVVITADGGVIANGPGFMSIGDVVLANGGRLTTSNGASQAFQAFNLRGSITVSSGTSGAFVDTVGFTNNGVHLGGTTIPATTFNVGVTGDSAADLTVSAPLLNEVYNTGALLKTGEGSLLLTATNSYTGTTTINAGVLALGTASAITSSPVIVVGTSPATTAVLDVSALGGAYSPASWQTLKGYGVVTGIVTIAAGTRLLPGDAGVAGTLHFANDLTMSAGSTNYFDLAGPGSGGSNDLIMVGGTLNLDGAGAVWINSAVLPDGEYGLFSYAGGFTGTFPAILNYGSRQLRSLTNHDNTIWLSLTGTVGDLYWTGAAGSIWQTNGAASWNDGGGAAVFCDMDRITLDERGAASGAITITGAVRPGSLVVSNSTFNYALGGTGSLIGGAGLVKSGTGTLSIGNANTFTGDTVIEGGKVIFGLGGTIPATSRILVGDGATLTFGRNDTWGAAGTTSSAAVTVNAGGTLSPGGYFQTVWNTTLNGGSMLLNGGVNATYPTFQLAGTLTATGAASIVVGTGANNVINIGGQGNAALVVNMPGTADVLTVSAPLQNSTVIGGTQASSLLKSGGGTMELDATNTYTGSTIVQGGVLRLCGGGAVTNTAALITQGSGAVEITNGTLTVAASASAVFGVGYGAAGTGVVTVAGGGVLNVGNAGGRTFIGGGPVGGPFGSGVLTIGSGGVVNMGAAGADPNNAVYFNGYGTAGNSALNLQTGGLLSTARPLWNGSSGARIDFDGGVLRVTTNLTGLIGVNVANVRNGGVVLDVMTNIVTVGQAFVHSTVGGDAAIDGGMTKTGTGTLLLSGASSFTGDLTLSAGELQASLASGANPVATALGDPTVAGRVVNVSTGTTLRLMSHDILGNGTTANTQIKFVVAGTLANNGAQYNLLRDVELQGGTLLATGGALATFGAYGLYGTISTTGTNPATISASGTYGVIHMGTMGSAGPVTFNIGATADLNVTATLVDRAGGAGVGSMVKSGPGTMTLPYTNTFSGGTTISAGTLIVNGALSATGTVTLVGGTLGGTGVVGSVSAFAGAVISPGNVADIGALTVLGDLRFMNDSTYAWDAGSATGDLVTVSGALYAPSRLTVNVTERSGGSVVGLTLMTFGTLSGSENLASWRIVGAPGVVYAAAEGNRIVLREATGALLLIR
jgi:fibronectin-binding autotransporter adhesin